ncbi:MAG: hypothetical protein PVI06_13880 [Desulfobacterales bacterium]|jgi:hypothetical protein
MNPRANLILLFAISILLFTGCSPKIHGTVQLVDSNMTPLEGVDPKGTVVNLINTTAQVQDASFAVTVDEKGKFESEKDTITPGNWKVEAARIGYETQTETLEIKGSSSKKLEFKLKKIDEGQRKSIEGSTTDADKIINPGEVNIRPPGM